MTIEQLRAVYNAQPFKPFILHLADGRHVPVHHRDFILAVPSGRTLFVVEPDDTTHIIDILLVTDLELKSPSSSGKIRKNGKSR